MSAYLITYAGYLQDLKVSRFDDYPTAMATLAAAPGKERSGFVVDENSTMTDLSSQLLIDLFNLWREPDDKVITKFESRATARKRFLTRLDVRFHTLPATEAPVFEEAQASPEPAEADGEKKENDMAKQKKERKTKRGTKPAKPVAEFRQVRAGSNRAKALKLMDGTKTAAQIAKALDCPEKDISTHAFCLHRDCGIGYKIDEDGKYEALYPGSKSYEDAIKVVEKK